MPNAEKNGVTFLASNGHNLLISMPMASGIKTRIIIVWITTVTGMETSGMFEQYKASSKGVNTIDKTVEKDVREIDSARSPLA